jgi:hypothetical protein
MSAGARCVRDLEYQIPETLMVSEVVNIILCVGSWQELIECVGTESWHQLL